MSDLPLRCYDALPAAAAVTVVDAGFIYRLRGWPEKGSHYRSINKSY